MYLDNFYTRATPIDIPKNKKIDKLHLNTFSGEVIVSPSSVSYELITGYVRNTPPPTKRYKKGDKILFHKDNIMSVLTKSK